MTFKDTLVAIRNDEIEILMQNHANGLRTLLGQVSVDALRGELYSQAGRLFQTVEAVFRIPVTDFFNQHSTYLTIKKAHPESLYRNHPEVVMLLERLRGEFTGMNVYFDILGSEFVFRVTATLVPQSGQIPFGNCSQRGVCHVPRS